MSRIRARDLLLTTFVALYGGALGALAETALWMLGHAGTGEPIDGPAHLEAGLRSSDPSLLLAIFGGAVLALLTVIATRNIPWVRRIQQGLAGLFFGGVAGIMTYVAGFLVTADPRPSSLSAAVLAVRDTLLPVSPGVIFCMLLGAGVGVAVARFSWRFQGVLMYTALVAVVAGYIGYSLLVSIPKVPPPWRALSVVLFAAEVASLVLVIVYAFYSLDVFVRKSWNRRPELFPFSRYHLPKVAFHVPSFNEPPGLVIETVRRLVAIDYPRDRFVVMVLDDSTDPECAQPLERFCQENGVVYNNRKNRKGYKAGALNEGLRLTPSDVDLIAIVDADYWVEPEYLRETVGYFINPNLAFVQTPQEYRNVDQSFLTRQYYTADSYFYRAILPSRNEENAIIFCGTMGIIRKKVLDEVGGWGEDFITEDAELSLRVLQRGYVSLYVDKTFGRGLIPPTYDGYKKQLHRWAFGGTQVLKAHMWDFFSPSLSRRQRYDYLVGGLHWFDGIPIVIIALVLAMLGGAGLLGYDVATHHRWEIWLVGLVPLFLLMDGLTRVHLALNRYTRVPFRHTVLVLGLWYSIKINNAIAALKALFGSSMPFVRTPKAPATRIGRREAAKRALRLTWIETMLASVVGLVGLAVGLKTWQLYLATGFVNVSQVMLSVWLVYLGFLFSTSLIYAYRSYVTFKPDVPTPPLAPAPPRGVPSS